MATGRYVLLERIGMGGMAEVFRATSRGAEGFERPIAIKRILPHLSEDQDFIKMFVDEAKIAVQLQHPNIVQIFDLGRDDREYFIAMEYVHGKDLRALLDRVEKSGQRIPISVAVHLGMKICEALHHAHFATGHAGQLLAVVHRDVTPQNILLSYDGEVKVTDFGLAKAAGRATQTQSGVVKGKLAYMAPEGFAGIPVDHRSDVFGVGILLWEMLAGMRLFLGRTDLETVENAQAARVPSLRSIDPTIPAEIDAIVLRALARDRDHRHQTAEELHDELEGFAYGHQEFLTSSALAGWLRDLFPLDPPSDGAVRGPEVATREIRLADLARGSHPEITSPDTVPPALVEELLGEADDDPDEIRDTIQPPAPAPDGFEDTTGRMSPARVAELATEMLHDDDLLRGTVPRAPAVPQIEGAPAAPLGLGWDDEEEATVVGPANRDRR
ncbi:MAG: serine/threonine protein kinase [Myxococcota bacterium]|nr:serine/threonine protein kinase [Myxococcota bacterium]